MKRRIIVPGRPLETSVVVSDAMKQIVIAIPHNGEIVVVFVGKNPTARAMNIDQARIFQKELKEVHDLVRDDVAIARMEKEFGATDRFDE